MRRKKSNRLIYIAGPLFTPGDRIYLEEIDHLCKKCGYKTYLPHRDAGLVPADGSSTLPFFEKDKKNLDNAEIILAVLNGNDVDSGTAWELGYAFAKNKILLGIYEDTRIDKPLAYFNIMITSSTKIFDNKKEIVAELTRIAKTIIL